jgi:hypothetical protein
MNSASVCGNPRILRASFKAPGVLWTSSTIAFLQFAFSAIKGKKREAIVRNGLSTATRLAGKAKSRKRDFFALWGNF